MAKLRTLVFAGAAVALTAASLAMPAAAADTKGTLALVNGIPGKKVDVCLNGKEIKSGLGYGKAVLKSVVPTGDKKLKFYARDPRTCRGTVLAKRSFPLAGGQDLTIVATKGAPKVVSFSNAGWGEIPPLGAPSPFAYSPFRSAAGFGVNLKWVSWSASPELPLDPAVDPVFLKGDEHVIWGGGGYLAEIRATLPEGTSAIATRRADIVESRRYEFILLGSKPGNARFVLISRPVSLPSP
jgi:hypothetical protein